MYKSKRDVLCPSEIKFILVLFIHLGWPTAFVVYFEEFWYRWRECSDPGISGLIPSAVHLLCSNHVRRNIRDKLHELHVSKCVKTDIVSDIFGRQVGDCHFKGLVDARSDSEFEDGVSALTAKWRCLDDQQDGPVGHFVSWFLTYKKGDIQHGLMRPVRQNASLGDPLAVFTTIASESINTVLKSKVHYRKSELPVLIDKLKEVIEEQDNEVERAVIGRGKYELCSEYKRLECDEQQWFLPEEVGHASSKLT